MNTNTRLDGSSAANVELADQVLLLKNAIASLESLWSVRLAALAAASASARSAAQLNDAVSGSLIELARLDRSRPVQVDGSTYQCWQALADSRETGAEQRRVLALRLTELSTALEVIIQEGDGVETIARKTTRNSVNIINAMVDTDRAAVTAAAAGGRPDRRSRPQRAAAARASQRAIKSLPINQQSFVTMTTAYDAAEADCAACLRSATLLSEKSIASDKIIAAAVDVAHCGGPLTSNDPLLPLDTATFVARELRQQLSDSATTATRELIVHLEVLVPDRSRTWSNALVTTRAALQRSTALAHVLEGIYDPEAANDRLLFRTPTPGRVARIRRGIIETHWLFGAVVLMCLGLLIGGMYDSKPIQSWLDQYMTDSLMFHDSCDPDNVTAQMQVAAEPGSPDQRVRSVRLLHVADKCSTESFELRLLDRSGNQLAVARSGRLGFTEIRRDDNTSDIFFDQTSPKSQDVATITLSFGSERVASPV